eukprot:gene8453-17429_t
MWSNLTSSTSKLMRYCGQSLDVLGRSFEVNPYIDSLQPSVKILKFRGKSPSVKCSFVASSASIIGQVNIGMNSSVWYGAVIRGDVNTINIGDGVYIGDRVVVHCSGIMRNSPTKIGNNVTIGPGAVIHGSTLDDECVIGAGALVLDGAHIQKHAMVGPGTIVTPGKVVPTGELWTGAPAAFSRHLTPTEMAGIITTAQQNLELATLHAKEGSKTWQMLEDDELEHEQIHERNDYYYRRLSKEVRNRHISSCSCSNNSTRDFVKNGGVRVPSSAWSHLQLTSIRSSKLKKDSMSSLVKLGSIFIQQQQQTTSR